MNRNMRKPGRVVGALLAAAAGCALAAEAPVEWAVPYPTEGPPPNGYPPVAGVEHVEIYRAAAETGWFSHHAHIAYHKGVFFAAWSNHPDGEDGPGQRVLCAVSKGGRSWSAPFECLPRFDRARPPAEDGRVATSVGWAEGNGRLYVIGEVDDRVGNMGRDRISMNRQDSTQARPYLGRYGWGRVARTVGADRKLGPVFWLEEDPPSPKEPGQDYPGLKDKRYRALGGAILAFLRQPERMPAWDFRYKTAWTYGEDGHLLCEPSVYRRPDGVLVKLSRDRDFEPSFTLYAAVSEDGGKEWKKAVRTNIPDSPSKSASGRLPDGRVYLIGNQVPRSSRGLRDPLVLSLSKDGKRFDRAGAIRWGAPEIRSPGSAKSRGFQYPSALVAEQALWVVYSIGKEDVAVTRVPLESLR